MLKPINKKIKLIIITLVLSFFGSGHLYPISRKCVCTPSKNTNECFVTFCAFASINMFCHHNEITLWINDSICMAFVGSNFNILEHYTILCVFNIQTVCSLASAVVETNVLSVYQSQFTPSISLKFRRNLSNSIK